MRKAKIDRKQNKKIKALTNKVKKISLNKQNKANPRQILKLRKALGPNRRAIRNSVSMYEASVMQPELMLKAQIPKQFGQSTIPISRHVTIPITTNASGNFWLAWQPYALGAVNDTTGSSLYLLNENAYTGSGSDTLLTGYVPKNYYAQMAITAGALQSFSLVSASLIIQPQVSMLNLTGKLGAGTTLFTPTAGSATATTTFPVSYTGFGAVEQLDHYKEAYLVNGQSLRIIYTVADLHDLEKYAVGSYAFSQNEQDTTFMAYGTGLPASSKLNLELYMNFDCIPVVGTLLTGLAKPCTSIQDPFLVHSKIATMPNTIVRAIAGNNPGSDPNSLSSALYQNSIRTANKIMENESQHVKNETDKVHYVNELQHFKANKKLFLQEIYGDDL
jgi:hypothetical protein